MKVTSFNPRRDLIIVRAIISSRRGKYRTRLVLDTGAGMTTLKHEVVDALGYSARDGERVASVRSVVGKETGYTLRVSRLRALGHQEADVLVHAMDLPEGWGIGGLLGLDFLRRFNLEIRPREGHVRAERISDAD
jgi:predicted aspartyl protease